VFLELNAFTNCEGITPNGDHKYGLGINFLAFVSFPPRWSKVNNVDEILSVSPTRHVLKVNKEE